jgi:hypothetical protein
MANSTKKKGAVREMNRIIRPIVLSILADIFAIWCFDLYFRTTSGVYLWMGIAISFAFTIYALIKGPKEVESLAVILLFANTLRMLTLLQTPLWGFGTSSDAAFNFQLSGDIQRAGGFSFGVGFERTSDYTYNPALNIWAVVLSVTSGMNLNYVSVLLFPILSCSILVLFYYLSIRSILGKTVATWACLVLTFAPTFSFFEAVYSKEPFGLMFLAICLYATFSWSKSRLYSLTVIGFLSAFLVVLAHQWTAYNLLIILGVILVLRPAYAGVLRFLHKSNIEAKRFVSSLFCIAIFVLVFSWFVFIEAPLFPGQIQQIRNLFRPLEYQPISHSMAFLPPEGKVLVYVGFIFLALLGAKEFLAGLSSRSKGTNRIVVESWFIFSAAYILVFTYLLPQQYQWATISQRAWIFAFLGLAPLISISIVEIQRGSSGVLMGRLKKAFPLLLVLPLASAVLLAPPTIINPTHKDLDYSFYTTAYWMKSYCPNATVATDFYSWNALIPYGRVNYYPGTYPFGTDISAFATLAYGKENFDFVKQNWKTFVFNKRISEWFNVSADPTMYNNFYDKIFDSQSLSIYRDP